MGEETAGQAPLRASRMFRCCLSAIFVLLLSACQSTGDVEAPSAGTREGPVTIVPQSGWDDAIIYFVLVDRFADGDAANNQHVQRDNPGGYHGGDLKGLAEQIDEIADLGATAIWINPVQRQIPDPTFASGPPETGTQAGFEHWGFHGYWMDDFNAIEPHFGSEADLKALVDAAHARGIKVLLDVVYNHAGYGARYEVDPEYRGWIRSKPVDCGADPLTCQVGGLPDFDTDREDVREYLFEANLGLAERTGIDGFRLDTVKHIDHGFWQEHRARTRQRLGDDFFLLAEVWGGSAQVMDDYFANDEMDAGFDFTFRGSCRGWTEGKGRTVAFNAYLDRRHRVRSGYHLAHYLSSHDEPMFLYEMGADKDRLRMCVALQMTSLGIPVIYYGEEVGREGSVWPTNRKNMPWGSQPVAPGAGVARDEALRDFYQRLIQARRDNPALRTGAYRSLHTDGDLLVFAREDEATGSAALVAVNRGEEAAAAAVELPAGFSGSVREVVAGDGGVLEGSTLKLSVPGKQARVFVPGD